MDHRPKYEMQTYKTLRKWHRRKSRLPWIGWWLLEAWFIKEIIANLDFIKIGNFYSAKTKIKNIGRWATAGEKILAKDTAEKGLLVKRWKDAPRDMSSGKCKLKQ